MIGSFWNLCRACPSMPVDKLHSEYRSTYRWHEYTGPRQEVVRRPPQPNTAASTGEKCNGTHNTNRTNEDVQNELPKLEPALPRRKKHPELAYRHHEFLNCDGNVDATDSTIVDRARVCDSGLLRKAISKISTEYRLQFAWPQGHVSRRDEADSSVPRKSLSMGAIKPSANAMVHRKRTDNENNKDASELEPLVNDSTIPEEDKTHGGRKIFKTEYKKKFRPFSQYGYSEGRFTDRGLDGYGEDSNHILINDNTDSWYGEVVELRKKAGEYKCRGWGTQLVPEKLADMYSKQIELWDQVSRRSSLSALSLASTTHRSYTKEEKEQENVKKSSPDKAARNAENSVRMMRDMVKHHLERTTGGSEFDGLILSPTRDKLEPSLPRKDDDIRGSQRGSPQKSSPQKGSPQKSAPTKKTTPKSKSTVRTVRSQSVGPTDMQVEKRSPKRQSRSATVKEKKSTSSTPSATRRPRPSDPSTKTEKSESLDGPAVTAADRINYEPVVKSPPEPTRVKSPEQILMRSPDPVNWTVPLDTGKTFTVTQNVRESDITRPHSEVKAWTPPEIPPPAAQSAPPELAEQIKEPARKLMDNSDMTALSQELSPASSSASTVRGQDDSTKFREETTGEVPPVSSSQKLPEASGSAGRSLASEVLEKARNRFDRFWGKNSNDDAV